MTFQPKVLKAMDAQRGLVTRSAYLASLVLKESNNA